VAKLGANGSQRVDAIANWLRGVLGDDLARDMGKVMVTERIVRGWERIINKFVGQGAAGFSQAHRDVEQSGLSDEQWASMSHGARLDCARSHDQSKFR
jgi:hypothetical protein